MCEKVGKSRNTVFFQWFGAPEGRKVGSLKRRVRSQLARWEMKNCTPLWRGPDHFRQLRCRKSACRCGAKHISKSKCSKHLGVRTTFGGSDVASLHYTTLHSTTLHSLHYATLHSSALHYTTLHSSTLHYTEWHYTTLHYPTLRSTTLNYTTSHYTTLQYTPLHFITLYYTIFHYTSLPYTTLHSITLQLQLIPLH